MKNLDSLVLVGAVFGRSELLEPELTMERFLGECTSELVSAFGSEELGAGFSDFDMSTANTISPSDDFSRDDDWLEPDLSEAHLRHPALDGQSNSGSRMRRSTSRHSNCSSSRIQQTTRTTTGKLSQSVSTRLPSYVGTRQPTASAGALAPTNNFTWFPRMSGRSACISLDRV